MSDAGVQSLPQNPEEMPNVAAWAQIGVDPVEVDSLVEPTEAERAMAVLDAKCRVSAGFDAALYEAEVAENARLTAAKVEDLESERRAHELRRSVAEAIVTSYLVGASSE